MPWTGRDRAARRSCRRTGDSALANRRRAGRSRAERRGSLLPASESSDPPATPGLGYSFQTLQPRAPGSGKREGMPWVAIMPQPISSMAAMATVPYWAEHGRVPQARGVLPQNLSHGEPERTARWRSTAVGRSGRRSCCAIANQLRRRQDALDAGALPPVLGYPAQGLLGIDEVLPRQASPSRSR